MKNLGEKLLTSLVLEFKDNLGMVFRRTNWPNNGVLSHLSHILVGCLVDLLPSKLFLACLQEDDIEIGKFAVS